MSTYAESSSPHIHSSGSLAKTEWLTSLALLPVWIASLIHFGWQGVRVTALAIAAAILTEVLTAFFFHRKAALQNGTSFLIGFLFAMMLPPFLPSWMVVLGTFMAVFLGKEIFGSFGSSPFNPTQVGRVFLQVSFPVALVQSFRPVDALSTATPLTAAKYEVLDALVSKKELLLGDYTGCLGETSAVAILIGGIVLIGCRLIHWEVPVLFIGLVALFSWAGGSDPWLSILSGGVFLSAFFVITDPVTSPITRQGKWYFVAGVAILVVILRKWSYYPAGISFSVLMMNALVPWIDRLIKPGK